MSLHRSLSRSKNSDAAKPSKIVTFAAAGVIAVSAGLVTKSAYDFVGVVTKVQSTIAPIETASQLPSEAEGAFYFIEPQTTTL